MRYSMTSKIIKSEKIYEKLVPISIAEAMGAEILDDSTMLLEFGFVKQLSEGKPSNIIIDVRKKISAEMTSDLYKKLKKHFEKSE